MSRIVPIEHRAWSGAVTSDVTATATAALESGRVLFFPYLPFIVEQAETEIFSPAILSSSKNTSFDPESGRVGGTTLEGRSRDSLRGLLARFSDATHALVRELLPAYAAHVQRARTSFRPAEIAGRRSSWRKDDSRLHVDAFPASPVQARRILRVFSNVNPLGAPRTWRVGGEFSDVARRFDTALALPLPWSGALLRLLHVTKSRRTPYDALMLQLHDLMKGDVTFQREAEQEAFEFPAGSTWMALTDQVGHAAMAGQYQLEQTYLLPVAAMQDQARSPLRVLERLKGRALA